MHLKQRLITTFKLALVCTLTIFQSNLFADTLREMSTDRPDTTESPYTVDAGHVQMEMSFLTYTLDENFEEYSVAPFNFKVGLTEITDIQFVAEPYVKQRDHGERVDGFGTTQIRLKNNIWGDDGGETAFAIMPYIEFPSGNGALSSDQVAWGIILPLAVSLPQEFSLGVMAELDFVRNETDTSYDSEFLHSATFGHSLYGDLNGYAEYAGTASTDLYKSVLNIGTTYGYSENVQLDCGLGIGLNEAADNLIAFAGISLRV